jgi:hypothetical protein
MNRGRWRSSAVTDEIPFSSGSALGAPPSPRGIPGKAQAAFHDLHPVGRLCGGTLKPSLLFRGMDEEIASIRNRQLIVRRAFEGACQHLGIGLGSLDVWRRERVAQIVEHCAAAGDVPLETLQPEIVDQFLQEFASKAG